MTCPTLAITAAIGLACFKPDWVVRIKPSDIQKVCSVQGTVTKTGPSRISRATPMSSLDELIANLWSKCMGLCGGSS